MGVASSSPTETSRCLGRYSKRQPFIYQCGISERPHPSANLGTQRTDANHSASLQLEPCLGHCGPDAHQLPVSPARRQHQEGRDCRIPQGTEGPLEDTIAGDLGWIEGVPKPIGSRIPGHTLSGHIQIAFLPPYAPDLNPVEYLWAWLKRHALANYCPSNLGELQSTARKKLKSAQKRPSIIAACWMQATLW